MKKIFTLPLAAGLVLAVLAGCNNKPAATPTPEATPAQTSEATPGFATEPAERISINIAGMTGSTSMGLVQLLEESEQGTSMNEYVFSIYGSADEVTPKLIQGELDIAAVPVNLASVLYNNTDGGLQLLAVNTLGVLYIVEQGDTVQSVEDLRGKTVYATGKGSVPEYNLRYILSENGIDPDSDLTIEWKSEPAEIVALMQTTTDIVAMMPQPYVTVAQAQVEELRIALDLTHEWDALDSGSMLVTGCLVVRAAFAEEYPEQIADFLEEYAASTEYVLSNVTAAAGLIEKYGIVKAAVAEKALPYCNLTCMTGAEMKSAVGGYLQILFEYNEKSVGGAMPDASFYYGA